LLVAGLLLLTFTSFLFSSVDCVQFFAPNAPLAVLRRGVACPAIEEAIAAAKPNN
jgi:hypothetical protein